MRRKRSEILQNFLVSQFSMFREVIIVKIRWILFFFYFSICHTEWHVLWLYNHRVKYMEISLPYSHSKKTSGHSKKKKKCNAINLPPLKSRRSAKSKMILDVISIKKTWDNCVVRIIEKKKINFKCAEDEVIFFRRFHLSRLSAEELCTDWRRVIKTTSPVRFHRVHRVWKS